MKESTAEITSDVINYEVVRRFEITGAAPMQQAWGNTMLTPCTVKITWAWKWTEPGPITPYVEIYGYRVRKDGTRADHPVSRIHLKSDTGAGPEWLRDLVSKARPPGVPVDTRVHYR